MIFLPKTSKIFWETSDFSGRSWYETLDEFLIRTTGFIRSRVEGCLYMNKKGNDGVKLINYVDDAL